MKETFFMHYDVNREQLLLPAKKIETFSSLLREAFSQREENFMQKMRTGVQATVFGKVTRERIVLTAMGIYDRNRDRTQHQIT